MGNRLRVIVARTIRMKRGTRQGNRQNSMSSRKGCTASGIVTLTFAANGMLNESLIVRIVAIGFRARSFLTAFGSIFGSA